MAVAKVVQEWFKENNDEFEVLVWPPDSPDLNLASAGCAGQTSLIHGGPTAQLTGPQHTFKGGVESLPRWVWDVLAAKRRPTQY